MNSLLELDISKFPKKPVVVNGKLVGTETSWKDLVSRTPQYFSNLLRTVRNPAQFSSTVHTKFTTIRRQLLMDPPNRTAPLILTERYRKRNRKSECTDFFWNFVIFCNALYWYIISDISDIIWYWGYNSKEWRALLLEIPKGSLGSCEEQAEQASKKMKTAKTDWVQNSEDQWVTGEDLTKPRGARGNRTTNSSRMFVQNAKNHRWKPERKKTFGAWASWADWCRLQFWMFWKILKAEHVEHVDFKRFERGGGVEG